MTRLSNHLRAQRKVAEIADMIEREAARLQDASEAKESEIRAVRVLIDRKARLVSEIAALEQDIKGRKAHIVSLTNQKKEALASHKKQAEQERKRLRTASKELEKVLEQIANVQVIANDLQQSILQVERKRQEYREVHDKAAKARKEYKEVHPRIEKEKVEIVAAERGLASMNQTVMDMYGKLASYVQTAKKTLKYVNEELEKQDIPVVFDVPEGDIIEIDIDNFDDDPNDKRSGKWQG